MLVKEVKRMQQKLCRYLDQHTGFNIVLSFIGVPLFLVASVSSITLCIALLAEGIKSIFI